MCISYCFSTAKVFVRTWLNVTLCVYCLSCLIFVPADVAMRTFDVATTVVKDLCVCVCVCVLRHMASARNTHSALGLIALNNE